MSSGRFAPSPTGSLHVGNLRTALAAWLFARSSAGRFVLRIEDLDPVACDDRFVGEHLADLAALGLDHDGDVVRQSDADVRARHEDAVDRLAHAGLLYPCWCSRREVAAAAQAAHGPLPEGAYPGTCRELTSRQRTERAAARPDRDPAMRVRANAVEVHIEDRLHGSTVGVVDDFVVRRGDGVPAYNLAVVVDDHFQGVEEVVRGDDLLPGTPRQAWLADVLDIPRPSWTHVPLVIGTDGDRLAKRHGAVTAADLASTGLGPDRLLALLGSSLDLCDPTEDIDAAGLLARFDPERVPMEPWVFDPPSR